MLTRSKSEKDQTTINWKLRSFVWSKYNNNNNFPNKTKSDSVFFSPVNLVWSDKVLKRAPSSGKSLTKKKQCCSQRIVTPD